MKLFHTLSALALGALLGVVVLVPAARADDSDSDQGGIECGQETKAIDLTNSTFQIGGFLTKAAAEAAAANPGQLLAELIHAGPFGGMTCPGCVAPQEGCIAYMRVVGANYVGSPFISQDADGFWVVTFFVFSGSASFGCTACA